MASLHAQTRQLRRQEDNDIRYRLRSILADAAFVDEVASAYASLPLVANLRNGSWYCRDPADECYFKSTDGHCGEWDFSMTRLNLHVAAHCARSGGAPLPSPGVRLPAPCPHVAAHISFTHAQASSWWTAHAGERYAGRGEQRAPCRRSPRVPARLYRAFPTPLREQFPYGAAC